MSKPNKLSEFEEKLIDYLNNIVYDKYAGWKVEDYEPKVTLKEFKAWSAAEKLIVNDIMLSKFDKDKIRFCLCGLYHEDWVDND